jgi:hypothetical protein
MLAKIKTINAHRRLMDRHITHANELRGDVLVILSDNWPRQADMLARQLAISETADKLVDVLIGVDHAAEG